MLGADCAKVLDCGPVFCAPKPKMLLEGAADGVCPNSCVGGRGCEVVGAPKTLGWDVPPNCEVPCLWGDSMGMSFSNGAEAVSSAR